YYSMDLLGTCRVILSVPGCQNPVPQWLTSAMKWCLLGFGRGGTGVCPRLRPKGQCSRLWAASELPGCRPASSSFGSHFLMSIGNGGNMDPVAAIENFCILSDGVKITLIVSPQASFLAFMVLVLHHRRMQ